MREIETHMTDATLTDALRPVAHFLPPRNWMNDPNGLIFWRERHHLFYQYNPKGASHGNIAWGHATSADLLHWEHLPIALSPDEPYDKRGCYSGCAVSDDDGLTLLYTGVEPLENGDEKYQTQCLARSGDGVTFAKYPGNPIIAEPPVGYKRRDFRDPYVWRDDLNDGNGENWWMVLGAKTGGDSPHGSDRGAVLLYRGDDLTQWRYVGELVLAPRDGGLVIHECPNFFRMGNRWVLLTSPIPGGKSLAWVGDLRGHRFTTTHQTRLDGGDCLYAPLTYRVGERVLMFAWLREARPHEEAIAAGWSGVMSLPRELYLRGDGSLGQRPAAEVLALRKELLRDVEQAGDAAVEIVLDSPAGGELVVTYTDGTRHEVALCGESTASGNENLRQIRVFCDRSVIEVFTDDGHAAAWRVYPRDPRISRIDAVNGATLREIHRLGL